MYVVRHNALSDSFRKRIVWFQLKQDLDRIRISVFKNRIGSASKNPLSDYLWCTQKSKVDADVLCGGTGAGMNLGGITDTGLLW